MIGDSESGGVGEEAPLTGGGGTPTSVAIVHRTGMQTMVTAKAQACLHMRCSAFGDGGIDEVKVGMDGRRVVCAAKSAIGSRRTRDKALAQPVVVQLKASRQTKLSLNELVVASKLKFEEIE